MVLEIKSIRKKIIPILRKNHVKKASLFGSYARGDQKKTSDVDILIEAPKGIGLGFVELKLELEKSLGKRVDLLTYKSIHPYLKKSILESEVRIL
ncbi:MAG: nucleotidyltransferase family protein [bacterium]|nr:nucleotidyltransferase family protein [bacterium]